MAKTIRTTTTHLVSTIYHPVMIDPASSQWRRFPRSLNSMCLQMLALGLALSAQTGCVAHAMWWDPNESSETQASDGLRCRLIQPRRASATHKHNIRSAGTDFQITCCTCDRNTCAQARDFMPIRRRWTSLGRHEVLRQQNEPMRCIRLIQQRLAVPPQLLLRWASRTHEHGTKRGVPLQLIQTLPLRVATKATAQPVAQPLAQIGIRAHPLKMQLDVHPCDARPSTSGC